MTPQRVAGLSLDGGRQDKFYLSLLEYYPDSKRWFLKTLQQPKQTIAGQGDLAIPYWIQKYELEGLFLDLPLSRPPCHDCQLTCPGIEQCPVDSVVQVRDQMQELLAFDQKKYQANPKGYEKERQTSEAFTYVKDLFQKSAREPLLSKSFKRKLKKGFLPYWNRPLDLWIWCEYYDQLLGLFHQSYDSFGSVSLMQMSRFGYLKKHLPSGFELYESHPWLCLLELHRAKVVSRKQLMELTQISTGALARLSLIKQIEKTLKVFLYKEDLEVLVKRPQAFTSFLLALSGFAFLQQKTQTLPEWTQAPQFIIPSFNF